MAIQRQRNSCEGKNGIVLHICNTMQIRENDLDNKRQYATERINTVYEKSSSLNCHDLDIVRMY